MRGRSPISSSSDEKELSKKKKKVKSKSKKRYSSSDSEDETRSPQKRSKSKKLASKKKKKDYKKSEKKRRNSKRYSSSDCSTCSDSDKSNSPVRKSKKRKRAKARGRKKLRVSESKHKRHKSSSSCSTCSESSSTWDSEEPFKLSPSKEKFEGKVRNGEQTESNHRQSPFNERFKVNYNDKIESSDGQIILKKESSDGQSLPDDRYRISYRQSPIKDRYESNFVQSSIDESFESRYLNNLNEMGNRRLRSIIVVKSLDEDVGKISETCDGNPSCRRDEMCKEGSKNSDFEMEPKEKGKEAVDLELILRQKALENLKKFRAARAVKVESHDDKKDEMPKGEDLDQSLQIADKTLGSKSSSSIVDQSIELKGGSVVKSSSLVVDQSGELKGSAVVNLPGNRIFKNAVHNLSNDSARNGTFSEDTSNTLKTLQESSNSKEIQNERAVKQNLSSEVNETEENKVSSSVAQKTEVPKAVSQSASGSQFEQKTFSRMRDGETVEVKYKVYIPKKTPALARRKLQR